MISRGDFLRLAAAGFAATLVPRSLLATGPTGIARASRMNRDFGDGATLGLDEILTTAGLLKRTIEVEVSSTAPADTIILSGSVAAAAIGLSDARHVLRVLPGRAARTAMLRRWSERAQSAGHLELVGWAPELFRYGATQLNDRFASRFGRGMNEDAWAGWISAKIAGEALLRSPDPAIEVRSMQVDGHKGVPLFLGADGTLVQPMFVVEMSGSERAVHEVAPEDSG